MVAMRLTQSAARAAVQQMASTSSQGLTRTALQSALAAAHPRAHSSRPPVSVPSSSSIHTSASRRGPWDGALDSRSGKPLNRYIIIAEDYQNAGALARRLEVRDLHLEDAKSGAEAGRIEIGGGFLSRDFHEISEESSPVYSLAGSVFVVQGESIDDVRARILDDQYAQAGVWDPSKIRILPFLPAFLNPPKVETTPQEQHDAVQRRIPRGSSRARPGFTRRTEVYVQDPRGTGKAINAADRASMESSLSALRRRSSKVSPAPASPTLDGLRRYSVPPVYGKPGESSSAGK